MILDSKQRPKATECNTINPVKDEAQILLFKDPVRTAQ